MCWYRIISSLLLVLLSQANHAQEVNCALKEVEAGKFKYICTVEAASLRPLEDDMALDEQDFALTPGNPKPKRYFEYLGDPGDHLFPLGLCQGDCNNDWDCAFGLNCFNRRGNEVVPGCHGQPIRAVDYCYFPPLRELVVMGNGRNASSHFPYRMCEGHCHNSLDCAPGLRCFQREHFEYVPGCTGLGARGTNYCYQVTSLTASPSSQPTNGRTPTVAPPGYDPSKLPSPTPHEVTTNNPSAMPLTKVPSSSPGGEPTSAPTKQPSFLGLRTEPTSFPTGESSALSTHKPSAAPSQQDFGGAESLSPTSPLLEFVGEQPLDEPLGQCQGHCTSDSDCDLGLVCTVDSTDVPGCSSIRVPSVNYCYRPVGSELVLVADQENVLHFPFGRCQGHCRSTLDCRVGLKCYRRTNVESVPGCTGQGIGGKNYCFDPMDLVGPTNSPSMTATSRPSDIPSSTPSLLPSVDENFSENNTPVCPPNVHGVTPDNDMLTGMPTSSNASRDPSSTESLSPSRFSMDENPTENSDYPSDTPSGVPSLQPTGGDSDEAPELPLLPSESDSPSSVPTGSPGRQTILPSDEPSLVPSVYPTELDRDENSQLPLIPDGSDAPSTVPSRSPGQVTVPSDAPSSIPSDAPTVLSVPSDVPSGVPSASPSQVTVPSDAPSSIPSVAPSVLSMPSDVPSLIPNASPSQVTVPSDAPSSIPSMSPTVLSMPSDMPSGVPSASPSQVTVPSDAPSTIPSMSPTVLSMPSDVPSRLPSLHPTARAKEETPDLPLISDQTDPPSLVHSNLPTVALVPSDAPSLVPSLHPSKLDSDIPSSLPSEIFSDTPSLIPSLHPTERNGEDKPDLPLVPEMSDAPSTTPSMKKQSDSPTSSLGLPGSPSGIPIELPTKAPSLFELEVIGVPPHRNPLGECQGSCNNDQDCGLGLNCFMRRGYETIPGCSGLGFFSIDYCYKPAPGVLVIVGDGDNGVRYPYGKCEGRCYNHSDCLPGLQCFHRQGRERVPGCRGTGVSGHSYCYSPGDGYIEDSESSSPATSKPTEIPLERLYPSLTPSLADVERFQPSREPSENYETLSPMYALQASEHPSRVPSFTPSQFVGTEIDPTTAPQHFHENDSPVPAPSTGQDGSLDPSLTPSQFEGIATGSPFDLQSGSPEASVPPYTTKSPSVGVDESTGRPSSQPGSQPSTSAKAGSDAPSSVPTTAPQLFHENDSPVPAPSIGQDGSLDPSLTPSLFEGIASDSPFGLRSGSPEASVPPYTTKSPSVGVDESTGQPSSQPGSQPSAPATAGSDVPSSVPTTAPQHFHENDSPVPAPSTGQDGSRDPSLTPSQFEGIATGSPFGLQSGSPEASVPPYTTKSPSVGVDESTGRPSSQPGSQPSAPATAGSDVPSSVPTTAPQHFHENDSPVPAPSTGQDGSRDPSLTPSQFEGIATGSPFGLQSGSPEASVPPYTTKSPSVDAYSSSPSQSPTKHLEFVGRPPHTDEPLGECQGSCRNDLDCKFGLSCLFRRFMEPVPGCSGMGFPFISYCFRPPEGHLVIIGEGPNLQKCQGECKDDSDCFPGLRCTPNSLVGSISGCSGSGVSGKNYCYDPSGYDASNAPSDTPYPSSESLRPSGGLPSLEFEPTASPNTSTSPSLPQIYSSLSPSAPPSNLSANPDTTLFPSSAQTTGSTIVPSTQISSPVKTTMPSVFDPPFGASPSSPTVQCDMPTSSRRSNIATNLMAITDGENFDDSASGYWKALNWIVETDPLYLCPSDDNLIQRFVLTLLYFETSGVNWKKCNPATSMAECNGEPFLSGAHECLWNGVSCDSSNHVVEIRLVENDMSGPLPDELLSLSHLVRLKMDSNQLSGTIPRNIGTLQFLEVVDLDRNNLVGSIPESLYDARALRVIDLDSNNLTGSISSKIGNLRDLYYLQLDFNPITGAIPIELGTLDNLQYLSIYGTSIEAILPELCQRTEVQIHADCSLCVIPGCCTACLKT